MDEGQRIGEDRKARWLLLSHVDVQLCELQQVLADEVLDGGRVLGLAVDNAEELAKLVLRQGPKLLDRLVGMWPLVAQDD